MQGNNIHISKRVRRNCCFLYHGVPGHTIVTNAHVALCSGGRAIPLKWFCVLSRAARLEHRGSCHRTVRPLQTLVQPMAVHHAAPRKQQWRAMHVLLLAILYPLYHAVEAHDHSRTHPLSELAHSLRAGTVRVAPQLPPIQLSTNTSEFNGADVVNVSWGGVLYPSAEDVLALYSPAHADPTRVVPVQYVKCSDASEQHKDHGRGWAT